MSTRINVNVDQAALLQRSREQTQANRLGFLEAQNRKKVEAEARRQRDANRAARGLTANGSMYNNRLRQLPQRPDPAAFRRQTGEGYAVAGVMISGILDGKPSNAQIRTITLTTVNEAASQAFDLYEFPFAPGYNSSGTAFNTGRTASSHNNALASTLPQFSNVSITGPGFGPANAAGLPSIKTVSTVYRSVESAEDYEIAHLPLAGGSLLVAIAGRYGGIAVTRNEVLTETVHSQTQPTFAPNPLNETAAIYFRNHSTTLTGGASTLEPAQYGDYGKCWLVTATAIKEVSMPQQLKAAMLSYVPEYTFEANTMEFTYTLQNRSYTDAGFYYAFDQPFETLPSSTPTPVRLSAEGRVYGDTFWSYASVSTGEGIYVFCDYAETTQTSAYYAPVTTQASTGDYFYNYDRFGLWGFASVDACYSPGVFAQLDDTSITYDYALNEDTGYLASNYMQGYPLPSAALQAVLKQDASNNDFRRFDIRKPLSNTLADENLLKENKSPQASFAQFNGFDFVWDWGKPAFCRSKLLALGFTEADLTP